MDPSIHIDHNVKYICYTEDKDETYKQNMSDITGGNSPSRSTPKTVIMHAFSMKSMGRLSATETKSLKDNSKTYELIHKYRCNSVLDLHNRHISLETWECIQKLLLSNTILPPIKSIDLRRSTITKDNIDAQLFPMVIV